MTIQQIQPAILTVHFSIVKSVDLDTWVQDQVENMVRWGNERANK